MNRIVSVRAANEHRRGRYQIAAELDGFTRRLQDAIVVLADSNAALAGFAALYQEEHPDYSLPDGMPIVVPDKLIEISADDAAGPSSDSDGVSPARQAVAMAPVPANDVVVPRPRRQFIGVGLVVVLLLAAGGITWTVVNRQREKDDFLKLIRSMALQCDSAVTGSMCQGTVTSGSGVLALYISGLNVSTLKTFCDSGYTFALFSDLDPNVSNPAGNFCDYTYIKGDQGPNGSPGVKLSAPRETGPWTILLAISSSDGNTGASMQYDTTLVAHSGSTA
jgi:hypothetical protein